MYNFKNDIEQMFQNARSRTEQKRKMREIMSKYGETALDIENNAPDAEYMEFVLAGGKEMLEQVQKENAQQRLSSSSPYQTTSLKQTTSASEDEDIEEEEEEEEEEVQQPKPQTDADAEILKKIRENRKIETKQEKAEKNTIIDYDNDLTAKQREQILRNGGTLHLQIKDNPHENGDWKWWCNHNIGAEAVRKYNNLIEKYAQQYNVDSNLVKAIMYTENACGHYYGGNAIADYIGISKSQMPMNIRGDIWGNFQGKHYDTRDSAQNIELATLLIKQISSSIVNPTAEKIITLWNSVGKNTISSFGYRGGMTYRNKLWLREIK